jgi:peroxiredoxin Q/BCP
MKTLKAGDKAPDFELPDQHGSPTRLSELLGKGPVVLFWYPAAMTGGCTQESCHFRDLKTEFDSAGAQRIGISMDSVAKQKQFADANEFDYPLLSDESGDVSTAYGVRRRFITPVKRATFVINTDQEIVKVVTSELKFDVHADEALAAVRAV